MAASPELRGKIMRTALAQLGGLAERKAEALGTPSPVYEHELSAALRKEFRGTEGLPDSTIRAIARRAIESADAAKQISGSPSEALAHKAHAADSSIRPEDERYRYRVVVDATGVTTQDGHAMIEVDSAEPMSEAQIEAHIATKYDWSKYKYGKTGETLAAATASGQFRIHIISAGRRE